MKDLRTPAWRNVVEQLSMPAASDPVFLARLLNVLTQVTSARAGMLFSVTRSAADGDGPGGLSEPRLELVWPTPAGMQPGQRPDPATIDHEREARSAAGSVLADGKTRAFSLESGEETYYGEGRKGVILSLPVVGVGQQLQSGFIVSLVLDARSSQAMQTTVALAEVVVGYARGHATRQDLLRVRSQSMALDLAAKLIASINAAPGFKGACLALCNDLQRQLSVDRVAIGWVKGIGKSSGAVRVKSISDTEHLDRRLAMVRKLELAMDECLDQQHGVMYPPPPEVAAEVGAESGEVESPDVLLAQAVTHEHKQLASGDANLRVASVPLRVGDEVLGVLTVESAVTAEGEGTPLNAGVVEWLQASMDLVAPVLKVRRSDDRNLAMRTADSSVKAGAWAVGPKHTVWKLVAIAVFITIVSCFIVHIPYKIEAPAELVARSQRVVSTPFSARLEMVEDGVRPGAYVEQGDLLARLDTKDIRLAYNQAAAQLQLTETRIRALREEGGGAELDQAEAEARAQQASVELYRSQIERAEIRAPISGVVVEGSLSERVGSTMSIGDPLFVIADVEDLIATCKVDDSDISFAERSRDEELGGAISLKADPDVRAPVRIVRIVPLAKAEEGDNRFEIRLEVEDAQGWMRPGMEGLVKIDTGDRSVAWILSRRIRETIRMWLWF